MHTQLHSYTAQITHSIVFFSHKTDEIKKKWIRIAFYLWIAGIYSPHTNACSFLCVCVPYVCKINYTNTGVKIEQKKAFDFLVFPLPMFIRFHRKLTALPFFSRKQALIYATSNVILIKVECQQRSDPRVQCQRNKCINLELRKNVWHANR